MYPWNRGAHQPMHSTALIPVILRVYVDDDTVCEVPITPESTWQDVVECCRDPGEQPCHLVELWRGYERPVRDVERPFAVLQDWGAHRDEVFFCLRPTPPTQLDGNPSSPTIQHRPTGQGVQQNPRQRTGKRNGMKEPTTLSDDLPDGVELTLSELQEMATRQQQQIESQQQMLVVKEQRLKFLKQQEIQHQQVSAESERLQRLREKMEAQETKLRKLRALWGQVDQQRMNNSNLTSELDTIRALFNEKEKELSVAVAKVDELTKQLEELRRGRANGTNNAGHRTSPAAIELEKLRRELMYHNKLNEQQNTKLAEQREALDQKQEEMLRIDKRIAELQQRLNKKRMLNQQLANQINAVAATKPVANTSASSPTATTTATTTCLAVGGKAQGRAVGRAVGSSSARISGHGQVPAGRIPASSTSSVPVSAATINLLHRPLAPNVAQVEPYQHPPKEAVVALPKEPSVPQPQDDLHAKLKEDSNLGGFQPNKNDPKYQTLPYNTKFSVKFGKAEPAVQPVFPADADEKLEKLVVLEEKPQVPSSDGGGGGNGRSLSNGSKGANSHVAPQTVHSTPAYTPARGQATAVLQIAASRATGGCQQQVVVAGNNLVPQSTNGHRTSSTQLISAPSSRSQYDTGQRPAGASTAAAVTVTSAPSSAAPASVTNVAIMAPQLTQPLTHAQPLPPLDSGSDSKVSAVATEQKQNGNNKTGILYHQTSSTRVQPPVPHTFSTTPQGLLQEVEELAKSQGKESPPESAIVELSSPESPNCPANFPKPALPPKPSIPSKPTPPPRQLHSAVDTSPDAVDSAINILRGSGKQTGNLPFSASDSSPTALPKKSTNNVLDQYLKSMTQMYSRVGEVLADGSNVQQPETLAVQDSSTDSTGSQRKTHPNDLPIKPKPLTIKKNAALEPPKLKGASLTPSSASPTALMSTAITASANGSVPTKTITALQGNGNRSAAAPSAATAGVHVSISRRIEMPPAFLFPENEIQVAADANNGTAEQNDNNNNSSANNVNNNNGTDRSANAKNLQLSCDVTDNLAAVHFATVPEVDKAWDLATSKQKGGTKRPVVEGGPADMTVNTQGPRTEGEGSSEPSSTGIQGYLEEVSSHSSQIIQSVDIAQTEQNSEVHQTTDQEAVVEVNANLENVQVEEQISSHVANVVRRAKKGNLKTKGSVKNARRVSFDPLALLLDASLEGELELVKKTAKEVTNPSAANDEGITALHNAICAGHYEIVKFLVEFGCDVNAQDSDGWTPLHCAASCNNLPMVKFLVEHGACIFATTLSDQETAAEKCEEDEEGFDGCSEYLYSIQEKLGILNNGVVYALYNYDARNADELSFRDSEFMVVLRKGDDLEREWWWSKLKDREGYIPRNLLGLYPRVVPSNDQ